MRRNRSNRPHRYVVIDIGCLECYNASWYLGSYPTVKAAKESNPSARLPSEITHWKGEGITVIFDASPRKQ